MEKEIFFTLTKSKEKKIKRKKLRFKNEELVQHPDSHTSIAKFYGISAEKEDKWNKWEYRITLQGYSLQYDTLNTKDDYSVVFKKLKALDMKKLWNASFKVYTSRNAFKKGETVLIKSLPFNSRGVAKRNGRLAWHNRKNSYS